MQYKHAFLIILTGVAIAACAAPQLDQPATQPPPAGSGGPDEFCALEDSDLGVIQERALEYVLQEWPVLDAECEEITVDVHYIHPDSCAISGGPKRTAACPEPSHEGYSVVFDKDTLEPVKVYFKVQ